MAIETLKLKQFDTLPTLSVKLSDLTSREVDLTTSGIKASFSMKHNETDELIIDTESSGVNIITGDKSALEYEWQSGNTDLEGLHFGEFELTYPSDKKQTVPESTYIPIFIYKDINNK